MAFGDMLNRIKLETERDDIDASIYDAVISAIAFYEINEFYFNQAVGTITATANQRYSSLSGAGITDMVFPKSLRVVTTASQYRYLEPRTFSEMEMKYITDTSTGEIYEYSVFAERFYWWFIPNAAYTVAVNYIKTLGRPSSLADTTYTNTWFTDGEAMIRSKAKFYLYADILDDEAQAKKFEAISQREKFNLDQKLNLRSYNTQIMGWI